MFGRFPKVSLQHGVQEEVGGIGTGRPISVEDSSGLGAESNEDQTRLTAEAKQRRAVRNLHQSETTTGISHACRGPARSKK